MKILEKTTSKDKNKKIETISVGKKKYKRISLIKNKNEVEWKRFKTNHQVKAEEFKSLEEDYGRVGYIEITSMQSAYNNSVGIVVRKGNNPVVASVRRHLQLDALGAIETVESVPFDSAELERILVDVSDNGARKLAGVKFIKEETGWSLREAKDFVDEFFKRKEVYNR